MSEDLCPDCGHRWSAHQTTSRKRGCHYRPYAGYDCPCDKENPATVAERNLAGVLWRQFMGYNER